MSSHAQFLQGRVELLNDDALRRVPGPAAIHQRVLVTLDVHGPDLQFPKPVVLWGLRI